MNTPINLDTVSVTAPMLGADFNRHGSIFEAAFRAVALNRIYGLTESSRTAGVGLARTIWATIKAAGKRDDNALQRVLEIIVPLISTALQSWRPGPELPSPKQWVHPLTGLALPNAFDPAHPDFVGQKILADRDPRLAELSRRAATAESLYALVAQLADEAAQREELRRVQFGATEYASNVFRRDMNEPGVLEAQSAFVKSHSEQVVNVWRFEAGPVIWPWQDNGNRTELGRALTALKQSPVDDVIDGNILLDAAKLTADLVAAQRQAAIDAADAAQKRADALRRK